MIRTLLKWLLNQTVIACGVKDGIITVYIHFGEVKILELSWNLNQLIHASIASSVHKPVTRSNNA